MTRGRITLLSPQLEKKIRELFITFEANSLSVKELVLKAYSKKQKSLWLDSQEEMIFFENYIADLLGPNYEQFVLPQVQMSSLLSPAQEIDPTGYQRVDFAIFHPALKEKIIVEIDGKQHKIELDRKRVNILKENGYTVINIPVEEIQKGNGPNLSNLSAKLTSIRQSKKESMADSESNKFVYAVKIAHQIQILLLQAVKSGFLDLSDVGNWYLFSDLDETGLFSKTESLAILKYSAEDFVELLEKLSRLYSAQQKAGKPVCDLLSQKTTVNLTNSICISFSNSFTSIPTFHVQNIYFPFHIANSTSPVSPVKEGLMKPKEEDLQYFLEYIFRKPSFWEGQYDGIIRILQNKDALLLLPTGAGKSLVYQLASLLLPGRTVVVDPIISLMEDQIDNLAMMGIDRCIAITSQIGNPQDRTRVLQLFGQGEYIFAFVSPERFQIDEFRESLRTLTVHTPIAMIVIDEAHCVSEWGHDFRTAYLNIGKTSREYCKSEEHIPPLLALTGTASRAVLKDVQRELQITDFDAVITPKTFDRPELKFRVIYASSQEKLAKVKGYLGQVLPSLFNTDSSTFYQTRGKETYSGLVFCTHVGGEFGIEKVSDEISKGLGIANAIYSGRKPKYWEAENYQLHKQNVTKDFKRNKIPLLVCTKAFGMGIDKPNIRYTIHFGIPASIESFYQEAGRAGRDRKTAYCCVALSIDDPDRAKKLLSPNTKVEKINEIIKKTDWEENDDITRILYFHTNSFRGIAEEKKDVEVILRGLGDVSKKGIKTLSIPDSIRRKADENRPARQMAEKAIHRLSLIGVVADYTINFSRDEFTIKLSGAGKEEILEAYGNYVASYLQSRRQAEIEKAAKFLHLPHFEFILEMINLLLHFIYEVIERGRRHALYEMLLACTESPNDSDIRQRILRYLEATEYSEELELIIEDETAGLNRCRDLFDSVRSPNEAAELRGQVSRYLESYPDHPALLMLRALSEVFAKDKNSQVAKQNFLASISSALASYSLSNNAVFVFACWAVANIERQDKNLAEELIIELLNSGNRSLARMMIEKLSLSLAAMPAWFLLIKIQEDCCHLLENINKE